MTHSDPKSKQVPTDLIGVANEVGVKVEEITCTALIDTGSQVTTISQGFFQNHLHHLPLYSCQGLVRIEGAGGDGIPYTGYIIISIQMDGVSSLDVPVLVVNDTVYNSRVPLLIGTNVLSRMAVDINNGEIPERVRLAQQAIEMVHRHLDKSEGTYGVMYSAENRSFKPGEIGTICGNVRVAVPIPKSVALVSGIKDKYQFNVTPGLVDLDRSTKSISIELVNSSKHTVCVKQEIH